MNIFKKWAEKMAHKKRLREKAAILQTIASLEDGKDHRHSLRPMWDQGLLERVDTREGIQCFVDVIDYDGNKYWGTAFISVNEALIMALKRMYEKLNFDGETTQ